MKRRRLLLILLASVASIALAFFIWPREREPEYNGVPLSKWLERYGAAYGEDEPARPAGAILQIGTNALPFLLRWIQYEAPGWRKQLDRLYASLPVSMQNIRVLRALLYDGAERRAELSVTAFSVLGSKASSAADDLLRLALAENPRAPNTQRRATAALMNMTQAAPARDYFDTLRIR
jgi:hypothetical protein